MRPVIVVMVLVLTKHGCGMPLVDDEDAVEQFAAEAADEAFGDRVGPRCPYRCPDDAAPTAVKTASKAAVVPTLEAFRCGR
jgi:hypothetical protein